MTSDVIPDDVKQFLLNNIDSIAQWEGLLLLRAHPGEASPAEAVAQGIFADAREMEVLLSRLVAQGILTVDYASSPIGYRYRPPAEMDEIIGRAADLYRKYLIPITHLIHSKPKSRIQEFADAFKLRKDKE